MVTATAVVTETVSVPIQSSQAGSSSPSFITIGPDGQTITGNSSTPSTLGGNSTANGTNSFQTISVSTVTVMQPATTVTVTNGGTSNALDDYATVTLTIAIPIPLDTQAPSNPKASPTIVNGALGSANANILAAGIASIAVILGAFIL